MWDLTTRVFSSKLLCEEEPQGILDVFDPQVLACNKALGLYFFLCGKCMDICKVYGSSFYTWAGKSDPKTYMVFYSCRKKG